NGGVGGVEEGFAEGEAGGDNVPAVVARRFAEPSFEVAGGGFQLDSGKPGGIFADQIAESGEAGGGLIDGEGFDGGNERKLAEESGGTESGSAESGSEIEEAERLGGI